LTVIESVTFGAALVEAVRRVGALEATGTADSGSSSTLVDSILVHPNTDQLKGYNLYIYDGAAQGDDRDASAFTPGSDRISVVPDFSAALDTTSKYILLKPPWRIQWFIDGMKDAARVARRRILIDKTNLELITQDILMGKGQMLRWTASTIPDDWTLGSNTTATKETTQIPSYVSSAVKIVSDGSNAAKITFPVTNFNAYAGETVSLRAFVQQNTASRVTMSVTDGVATKTLSSFTDTDDFRAKTVDDLVIDDHPKKLEVTLDISSGGAVSAYFGVVRLIMTSRRQWLYEFPIGTELSQFNFLHTLELGTDEVGDFDPTRKYRMENGKPQDYAVVDIGATKFLRLEPHGLQASRGGARVGYFRSNGKFSTGQPPQDRALRLIGQRAPKTMSSPDDVLDGNASFYTTYAAWYAAMVGPLGETARDGVTGKVGILKRAWEDELLDMRVLPRPNSIPVYTV